MNLHFETEQDFSCFKQEIRKRLGDRERSRISLPEYRASAVAILMLNKDKEAHVFLTKRTNTVGTHKGEISFPGGAYEEGDNDITGTALRETWEEAGIKPEDVDILGEFDEFYSLRRFHVSTIVGAIKYPYNYSINADEIEACLEAPLSLFRDRKYDRVDDMEYDGRSFRVYYYSYNGFSIWGLTARILTEFGRKILMD